MEKLRGETRSLVLIGLKEIYKDKEMKNKFIEYHITTQQEFKDAQDSSLLVFDTSVLLDLYRGSSELQNAIKRIMQHATDRLFLPYHVGLEFHKNRIKVKRDTWSNVSNISRSIASIKQPGKYRKKSVGQELFNLIAKDIEKIDKKINQFLKDHQPKTKNSNDAILLFIENVFDGKVDEPFSEDEIKGFEQEYVDAISNNEYVAGRKDVNKNNGNDFGDNIILQHMIRKSKSVNKDVTFVTSETKDDWFELNGKDIVRPTPFIVKYFNKLSNQRLYVYTLSDFIDYMNESYKFDIDSAVVEEAAALLDSDSSNQSEKISFPNDEEANNNEASVLDQNDTVNSIP